MRMQGQSSVAAVCNRHAIFLLGVADAIRRHVPVGLPPAFSRTRLRASRPCPSGTRRAILLPGMADAIRRHGAARFPFASAVTDRRYKTLHLLITNN
jgi:hypothetical protein